MAMYTVVSGDTLGAIAKSNGMSLDELLKANPDIDDPNVISVGQTINLDGATHEPGTVPATDYTDADATRFNGLPGKPEIWRNKDNGTTYVVYYPEGMDPPVPLRYIVNSEDVLKTYFGDKAVVYDHEYTAAEMDALGAVTFGDVGEIDDEEGDPWSGFTIKMERARKAMPWLEDPDIFAIIAAAYLEGRSPQEYEYVGTDWYDSHNEAERAWLTKVAQDPAQALQDVQDKESDVRQKFLRLGVALPSDEVIGYITQQWAQGTWSEREANDQIAVLTGGGEGIDLDTELGTIAGGEEIGKATSYLDEVRSLYADWLGSAYPPSGADLAKWAGIMRDDEQGGRARLIEMLRSQRMALFPEYQDPSLGWSDISSPWKNMAYASWGVQVDDEDPFLQSLVRVNDANEAQKMLRREGFDRGYDRVVNQMTKSVKAGMGNNVRGAV